MDEPRLPARKRPNNVVVDLKDLKSRWLQWCQSVDMAPSQAMRVLVRRLENGQWPRGTGEAPATTQPEQRRSKALSVRPRVPLTREEAEAAALLADLEGVSVQWWIAGLVRARVADQSPVGRPALQALGIATLQLQAIGRNVNQIARQFNAVAEHLAEGRTREYEQGVRKLRDEPLMDLMRDLVRIVDVERIAIRDVLDENERRWGVRRARGGERGPV
jgi:hypothetical protein